MASTVAQNGILLNFADVAPSPCKDYCQVIVSLDEVIYRCWKISMRTDAKVTPIEVKDSYEDFIYDERLHSEIHRVFGKRMVDYLKKLANGQIDYLPRMPKNVLIQVIRYLEIEDVSTLAQVSKKFKELCSGDELWEKIYLDHSETPVTEELRSLAEAIGWRKLFFTNKLQLQVQLSRQARDRTEDSQTGSQAGPFLTQDVNDNF